MSKVDSCDREAVKFSDLEEELPVVPFFAQNDSGKCHDCFVTDGGSHHPGCDMEECPKCRGQLIFCGCVVRDWT
jgi:hypothetical protein